jgi:hypothetical protein
VEGERGSSRSPPPPSPSAVRPPPLAVTSPPEPNNTPFLLSTTVPLSITVRGGWIRPVAARGTGLGGFFYFLKLFTEAGYLTQPPLLIALTEAVALHRLPWLIDSRGDWPTASVKARLIVTFRRRRLEKPSRLIQNARLG